MQPGRWGPLQAQAWLEGGCPAPKGAWGPQRFWPALAGLGGARRRRGAGLTCCVQKRWMSSALARMCPASCCCCSPVLRTTRRLLSRTMYSFTRCRWISSMSSCEGSGQVASQPLPGSPPPAWKPRSPESGEGQCQGRGARPRVRTRVRGGVCARTPVSVRVQAAPRPRAASPPGSSHAAPRTPAASVPRRTGSRPGSVRRPPSGSA